MHNDAMTAQIPILLWATNPKIGKRVSIRKQVVTNIFQKLLPANILTIVLYLDELAASFL